MPPHGLKPINFKTILKKNLFCLHIYIYIYTYMFMTLGKNRSFYLPHANVAVGMDLPAHEKSPCLEGMTLVQKRGVQH